jgi:hypothetical protein
MIDANMEIVLKFHDFLFQALESSGISLTRARFIIIRRKWAPRDFPHNGYKPILAINTI